MATLRPRSLVFVVESVESETNCIRQVWRILRRPLLASIRHPPVFAGDAAGWV